MHPGVQAPLGLDSTITSVEDVDPLAKEESRVRPLLRHTLVWFVTLALVVSTSACHDYTQPASVAGASLAPGAHTFVQSVTLNDGRVITLDKPGGRIANGRVVGFVKQVAADIDLADVERGVVF